MIKITRFEKIEEYLVFVEDYLLANEARNTMPLGILDGIRTGLRVYKDAPLFLALGEGASLVGTAIQTPPHGLIVTTMNDSALRALVDWCKINRRQFPSVVGPMESCEAFSKLWCDEMGKTEKLFLRFGEYALDEVTPGFPLVGNMRVATLRDLELCAQWTYDFAAEAVPHEKLTLDKAREQLRPRIEAARVFLLEDEGQIVSKVSMGGDTRHSTRIGQVYTPPKFRKKGYAGALTAQVSQLILEGGKKFANLFTDLANPTSNSLYQRIGYRYLGESRHIGFE